jgi:hypothetical protein
MVFLRRRPGEAIVVGRRTSAEEPRLQTPPRLIRGGSAGGGAGPAPSPASALASVGPAARLRHGLAPAAVGSNGVGAGGSPIRR